MPTFSRRTLIASLAASAGFRLPRMARAASELSFATWGSDEIRDLSDAFVRSFINSTGINVVFDGTGPSEGKISTMVDSGQVEWDICDVDGYVAEKLRRSGALSAIDYSLVDQQAIFPFFARDTAVCGYTYSFVLAYDAALYRDNPPKGWSDFFDLKKFPGKRALWKWMIGGFEAAALAQGASLDGVYPLNIDQAIDQIASLQPNLVFWETGDQVKQMLLDRTVSMACIWHSRALEAARESAGTVAWSFNQGLLCPGMWVVPRQNPGGVDAFRLLSWMQVPERQIALTQARALGPANPIASQQMPSWLRPIDPTQPEAMHQQVIFDSNWWADHYDNARERFQDRALQG